MQAVLEKNIMDAISQFSCWELPKPIKVRTEISRAQKKQNPIRAGFDRRLAAFRCRETAT
jgi:hypothetical protein